MQEVSVIIPNYNGMAYLEGVLSSLEQQEFQNFETILVDNGSSDGSVAFTMGNYPWVHIIELPDNFGFSRAVNEGIYAARAPYVLLLNNDTEVKEDFVEEVLKLAEKGKSEEFQSRLMECARANDWKAKAAELKDFIKEGGMPDSVKKELKNER